MVYMKTKYVISIMVLIWLGLMANIIREERLVENNAVTSEEIAGLQVAQYTSQLLVIEVWNDESMLRFFQKDEAGNWQMKLETESLIGENGLGKRVEGDRKTPTGVYRFTRAFGVLPKPDTSWDYLEVDERHYWVDDAKSKYYNQLVSTDVVCAQWSSAEHICEYPQAYAYVLALNYNADAIPGKGSAVFLHCTSAKMEYTAGCIAIPQGAMEELLGMLDEECLVIIDRKANILEY